MLPSLTDGLTKCDIIAICNSLFGLFAVDVRHDRNRFRRATASRRHNGGADKAIHRI